MALLYRYVKLHDRADSHVFTFVVTRSVTRDPERDVTSKELTCGYQRWAITFSRTDKVLGVYLVWKSACQGMRVYVDFTFTLLNREHFSCNEAFAGKQVGMGHRGVLPSGGFECPPLGSSLFRAPVPLQTDTGNKKIFGNRSRQEWKLRAFLGHGQINTSPFRTTIFIFILIAKSSKSRP